MITRKETVNLLQLSYRSWSDHNAPRLGAALSFYMLLSMAPLLILLVTICGLVFTGDSARQQILVQVREVAGTAGQRAVAMLIDNARQPGRGLLATVIALITLLSGASGVFLELRDSLNIIWGVPRSAACLRSMVWQRVISFGMVLSLGLLLLASLIVSAVITFAENFFIGVIPVNAAILISIANFLVPLALTTVLFGLIFKYVPAIPVAWSDVRIGAFVTAVLFSIGKGLLALYLGTVGVGSTYGAAGSLVAFIVCVYYFAQIFFFGAAFTKGYAVCCGSLAKRNAPAITGSSGPGLLANSQSA